MSQPASNHTPLPAAFLDCSDETTEMRSASSPSRGWLREQIAESHWLFRFDQPAQDEIRRAADFIASHPVDGFQRTPDDLALSRCRQHFDRMRQALTEGVGFVVADRLPVDDYPLEVIVELYWVLGQLIDKPVAQKRNGQMIYDVRDTKKAFGYGVRGSWTNVELNFHTDNAFGKRPPEFVGLLCRHPAASGGVSRFCSLYSVHQRLEQRYPEQLQRLYQPMLYDRQKEHADGEAPVTLAPFFSWRNDRLRARANPSLVRKGYEVAEIEMDAALAAALAAVDEVSQSPDLWFEASLEKGQIQYLNNSEVGHYRSEFVDFEEEEKRRHLFRLWHRDEGSVCYDGDYGLAS